MYLLIPPSAVRWLLLAIPRAIPSKNSWSHQPTQVNGSAFSVASKNRTMIYPVLEYGHASFSQSASRPTAYLVPWSLTHDLPNYPQISQYFIITDNSASTSAPTSSQGDVSGSFRGRRIVGTRYSVPEGMRMELWDIRENDNTREVIDQIEVSMQVDEVHVKDGGEGMVRRSSRKRAAVDEGKKPKKKAKKGKKNFSLSDNEEDVQPSSMPMPIPISKHHQDEDVYSMLRKNENVELVGAPLETIEIKKICPLERLEGIVIWNPDVGLEEGEDCYVKALREWTTGIRSAIHDD